ncbi:MAG TPA: acylphosphatase [bacterium]|jgi:acylphosphatase
MADVVRIVVRGLVQGVGFRYFVAQQARSLGVSGWVRNLPGGEVEVLASLPPAARERFLAALQQGPPASHVEGLEVLAVDQSAAHLGSGFHVRR